MTVLSDSEIEWALAEGSIQINPLDPRAIQPASVDLTLGNEFVVFLPTEEGLIDPYEPYEGTETVTVDPGGLVIHPGEFVLGTTTEKVFVNETLVGRVDGKSSLGRLGLLVHSTAGYVDPGFRGAITLELSLVAPTPLLLRPGMPICQLSFHRLGRAASRPYGHVSRQSKYQSQTTVTPSRYHENVRVAQQAEASG